MPPPAPPGPAAPSPDAPPTGAVPHEAPPLRPAAPIAAAAAARGPAPAAAAAGAIAWERVAAAVLLGLALLYGLYRLVLWAWPERPDPLARPMAELTIGFEGQAEDSLVLLLHDGTYRRGIEVTAGTPAVLSVPANTRYRVTWQGQGLLPRSSAEPLVLSPGPARWRLVPESRQEDRTLLALELDGKDRPATRPAEATALLAATLPSPDYALLPELDRATGLVGLFETGTAACATVATLSARQVHLGCLGFAGSALGQLLAAVEVRNPGLIDRVLGPQAASIRPVLGQAEPLTDTQIAGLGDLSALRARLRRLGGSRAFRIAMQELTLAAYRDAHATAAEMGLRSERGVLLVFDRMVQTGRLGMARLRADYLQRIGNGLNAAGPEAEARRIATLAELARAALPAGQPGPEQRLRIIADGRGETQGIAFDLDAIGIGAAAEPR
jgi:hypothetical protein